MIKLDFDRCKICNSIIIYDPDKREESGEYIPLDLNHKRHFCSGVDKIEYESQTVECIKEIIEDANSTELSSFQLELRIVDGAEK